MRRPLLIVFIFISFIAFVFTNKYEFKDNDVKTIDIKGTVRYKTNKGNRTEYKVDDFLVVDYNFNSDLQIGDKVYITGKLKTLKTLKYDDFDYGRYLRSNGYKGLVQVREYKIVGSDYLYSLVGHIKENTQNTFRYLYKSTSDFVNSLILGETNNLSEEQKDIFNRTGTSHVISISGLHTGILCSIILFILRSFNRYVKLIVAFIALSFYAIITGGAPSIIRSIFFIFALYFSVFIDRKRDPISVISLIGSILILNNLYIIYNVSFQLSFMATLSIIYFYRYVNKLVKVSIVSVSISANILTLPIIYYTFEGIPLGSLIGNLIIVPFIPLIMCLSLSSLFIVNISVVLARVIAYSNSKIIHIILYMLAKLSNIDFLYMEIYNTNIYFVMIYYIVAFGYMIYKEVRVMKEQENGLQGYYKECKE